MGRERREELIRQIEDQRNTKLLVYITGDRRGLETKIASDIFPIIYKHLLSICRFSNYLDRNFLIKLNNKDCFQIRLNWADR